MKSKMMYGVVFLFMTVGHSGFISCSHDDAKQSAPKRRKKSKSVRWNTDATGEVVTIKQKSPITLDQYKALHKAIEDELEVFTSKVDERALWKQAGKMTLEKMYENMKTLERQLNAEIAMFKTLYPSDEAVQQQVAAGSAAYDSITAKKQQLNPWIEMFPHVAKLLNGDHDLIALREILDSMEDSGTPLIASSVEPIVNILLTQDRVRLRNHDILTLLLNSYLSLKAEALEKYATRTKELIDQLVSELSA